MNPRPTCRGLPVGLTRNSHFGNRSWPLGAAFSSFLSFLRLGRGTLRSTAHPQSNRRFMSVSETTHSGISENSLGAASYLTVIPAIVFLAIAPYNRSANVRFHAWQSIALGASAFLLNFALNFLAQALPFL